MSRQPRLHKGCRVSGSHHLWKWNTGLSVSFQLEDLQNFCAFELMGTFFSALHREAARQPWTTFDKLLRGVKRVRLVQSFNDMSKRAEWPKNVCICKTGDRAGDYVTPSGGWRLALWQKYLTLSSPSCGRPIVSSQPNIKYARHFSQKLKCAVTRYPHKNIWMCTFLHVDI